MAPIRKGDGTAISPRGFQEVRKGDGTILWSAGSDIPDSGALQAWYDFSEYDTSITSNVPDLSDNGYDLTVGSFSGYSDINGVQAADFDGVDDNLYGVDFAPMRPVTVHAVAKLDLNADLSSWHNLHSLSDETTTGSGPLVDFRWDPSNFSDNRWSVWDEGARAGSTDETSVLFTVVYGGSTSNPHWIIRENGTETGYETDDTGREIDGIGLGSRQPEASGRNWNGAIGEWFMYAEERSSNKIDEAESYLADKWGITI